jgi:phage shock protein PspC (stress-responsive transcriptional regulator)
MNEVTKIHLGRQAFTISVDAHHELRAYLDAIKKQVEDKEVMDEIEIRMAELLTEHGIDMNKVILLTDVDFLKEQLGNPKDFKEDDDETSSFTDKTSDRKRLFRDTDRALIAGVCAGLAEYFGLDVLIIRILFVIATIVTAGWIILLYIVLWLLVPEAKTSSDRLLMIGKPVTVDSLKEIVERADVKGTVHRTKTSLTDPINTLFRLVLKFVGIVFTLFGLSVLFGLIAAESYILVHKGPLVQNNIFPVGIREHLLLDVTMIVVGLVAFFIMFFGIAIFRRKWPIRTWVTGILIGLIFIGLAIGGALTANIYPNVRDQYNSNTHTTIRTVKPFTTVNLNNVNNVNNINFVTSSKYYVSFNYYGHPNLASIITSVQNGSLVISSNQFNSLRDCSAICIPSGYNMVVTIYTPNAVQLINQSYNMQSNPSFPEPPSLN